MLIRFALACSALLLLAVPSPRATTAFLAPSDIKPGTEGVGVTVFEGTRREEFKVHILGVIENVVGPRRQLILARLEGGPLASAGVIAGMSGSPVYVDGRLIGAVAYSLGTFSKEPIAGITPIAEMLDATGFGTARVPARPVRTALPLSVDELVAGTQAALGLSAPFAGSAAALRSLAGPELVDYGLGLRPIATPLSASGLSDEARALVSRALASAGVTAVAAGAGRRPSAASDPPPPLAPGDAVGVALVGGDVELGATGTVTHIDGSHVYAFGHPLFNLGPTVFPMTRAYVHAVLPSLLSSFKLSSLAEMIGTVSQDRATAIAGTLGDAPATIPVALTLAREGQGPRQFAFSIASDQFLTPLLGLSSVVSVLQAYERELGAATLAIRGRVAVAGGPSIVLDDVFAGDAPAIMATLYAFTPVTLLQRNTIAPVAIERIELEVTASEAPRTAALERVWIDTPRVRPGDTVLLHVATRSYRGRTTVHQVPVTVPAAARGAISITVADGPRTAAIERREITRSIDAQNVQQIVRLLNAQRRANRFYVRLLVPDGGAVVHGEPMPALPGSVLAVLEGDRAGGVVPLGASALGSWEIPVDALASGVRTLTIELEPD